MKKSKFSIYLGSIAGTELYLHWTFLLFAVWAFFSTYREAQDWTAAVYSLVFLLSIFTCITLHELGHITIARRYGCQARDITLYPIGGVASLERIPDKPYQEFWMAIAGPFVNVVIAAILFLIISVQHGMPEFHEMQDLTRTNFLYNLMILNIGLVVFNMIPAFPMDGGRMLRSILAVRLDRVKATRIAAWIGHLLAIAAIIYGLMSNWWLVIIGIIIIAGARGELFMELNRAAMSRHKVRDVLIRNFTLVNHHQPLREIAAIILGGHERNFVVQKDDGSYGSLRVIDVVSGVKSNGPAAVVRDIMTHNVPVFKSTASLSEAFNDMLSANHNICPVVEDGQLIGVLEMDNINEFVAFTLAQQEPTGNKSTLAAP